MAVTRIGLPPSGIRASKAGAPMDNSVPLFACQGMLAMSARSSLRGLRSAVTGRLVRLRIGQLMDGRRSRAVRLRFMLDISCSVPGRQFVDAVPVGGRHQFR
jgi:hypothetical protein